jgi:hypothetical protein
LIVDALRFKYLRQILKASKIHEVLVLPLEIRLETWDPVPMTSGYVALDSDSRRGERNCQAYRNGG